MKKPELADDFEVSTKDPLAAEHADVIAWVEAAVKKLGDLNWYGDCRPQTGGGMLLATIGLQMLLGGLKNFFAA